MKRILSMAAAIAVASSMALSASAALEVIPGGKVFDAEYYAAQNPDVVAVVGTDTMALYNHYQQSGQKEGRKPYDESLYSQEDVKKFYAKNYRRSSDKPIEVTQILYLINSAGGVSPVLLWTNNTGKTIKYITFYMTPYNAVDDPVTDEITGKNTFACKETGPIKSNNGLGDYFYVVTSGISVVYNFDDDMPHYYDGVFLYRTGPASKYEKIDSVDVNYPGLTFSQISRWSNVWYNTTTTDIHITKVEIDFMDGTHQTLNNIGAPICHKITCWEAG